MEGIRIFWHRRDLRLEDNAGLYEALKEGTPVLPLFIFDKNILDKLEDESDARVSFIHDHISRIKKELKDFGSDIIVKYGHPEAVWTSLLEDYQITEVFTNRDYEPYAKQRDERIKNLLETRGVAFHAFKDHIIFEKEEVRTNSDSVYTVFSPYGRKWRAKLETQLTSQKNENGVGETVSYFLKSYQTQEYFQNFKKIEQPLPLPALSDMGFQRTSIPIPDQSVPRSLIKKYDETRNFPGIKGTSKLGIHFRFGTISIRAKARRAAELNDTYFNELIWRDFYSQILDAFPHVVDKAFRPEYDYIEWRNNEAEFERWCNGDTGYPIVDAGMRELNESGWMHNRVRMITASFLTKHLLVDWRWGEAYFAKKLLDFDLSSNNGGWQWAAGSGTDAAPYFRVFNPTSQLKKFDKDLKYVKQWVPEYGTTKYPDPVVDHKMARERCLETYKESLERGKKAIGKA